MPILLAAVLAHVWSQQTPIGSPVPNQGSPQLQLISAPHGPNGIVAVSIDVYDDASLRKRIKTLSTEIGTFLGVAPNTIQQGLFQVEQTEASSTSSNFSVSTNPLPSVETVLANSLTQTAPQTSTSLGGTTGSTINTTGASGTPTSGSVTGGTTSTQTNTGPTSSTTNSNTTTTTTAPVNPIPVSSAPVATVPTATVGPDAITRLGQYTEYYDQAMSLETVLDRARNKTVDMTTGLKRTPVVLGIPLSIAPGKCEANAVAEVDVKVVDACPAPTSKDDVSVVTVIPETRSYNVTRSFSSSNQVGAGIVLSVLNIGGSVGSARNRVYLAKDFDTVALNFPHSGVGADQSSEFGWQYRPVFSEPTVEPGPREALVALSLLPSRNNDVKLHVIVTTSWHKVRKGFVDKEGFNQNVYTSDMDVSEKLSPRADAIFYAANSSGSIDTTVIGTGLYEGLDLLTGSRVIGNVYNAASRTIKFSVTPDELLNSSISSISLFGELNLLATETLPSDLFQAAQKMTAKATESQENPDSTKLDLIIPGNYVNQLKTAGVTPIVGVGGKIYGLSEADLDWSYSKDSTDIALKVPTKSLLANPVATFTIPGHRTKPLVDGSAGESIHRVLKIDLKGDAGFDITTAKAGSSFTLNANKKATDAGKYTIYTINGRGLSKVEVVTPGTTIPALIPPSERSAYQKLVAELSKSATDSVAYVVVPSALLSNMGKTVQFRRTDSHYYRWFTLDAPAEVLPVTGLAMADVKQYFSGAALIKGENLKRVKKAVCADVTLTLFMVKAVGDAKDSWYVQIPQSLTKQLGPRTITLTLDDESSMVVPFNVVAK